MFGRRRSGGRRARRGTPQDTIGQDPFLDPGGTSADVEETAGADTVGPFDVRDRVDDGLARVDLGGLLVPVLPGTEVRVDVQDEQVVAANIVSPHGALQLQAFAAPRTEGIWGGVREELAAGISQSGGTADEQNGTLGVELRANVPVRRPDGATAFEPARFVGHDGPRWFLRGVLTGPAALDPEQAAPLEDAFRHVVVVRGDGPMPPREPLALRLPPDVAPQAGQASEGTQATPAAGQDDTSLEPFRRGPEITETR